MRILGGGTPMHQDASPRPDKINVPTAASAAHQIICDESIRMNRPGFRRHSGPSLRITPLELYRRQVTTGTVAAFWVVEHFDVVEHIGPRGIFG
jgi:hypothetical protein